MEFFNKVCIFLIFLICNRLANAQTTQSRHHRGVNRTSSAYNGLTRNDGYEKLFEKITNLENSSEQELSRLAALENKLSRIEVTNTERLDSVRADLTNLDWVARKSDGNLEQLRSDIETMSRNLDSNTHLQHQRQTPSSTLSPLSSSDDDVSVSDKLTGISTLLLSTRTAILDIEGRLNRIVKNVTNLLQITNMIHQRQHAQPTKQYLNNALHSNRAQQPIYTVLQSQNPSGQLNPSFTTQTPISCAHLGQFSDSKSGVHKIGGKAMAQPFYVWCDMETQDGGWTVIQNRQDGSINFNRNWLEYKNGFGNIAGEFFIGLDKLHILTNHLLYELLIVMEDFNGTSRYAKYSPFAIGGEKEEYALNLLGSYEGTAGDALQYSASHKFSTFDNDNDGWIEGNCAQAHTGAWWYNACEMANLNGKYLSGNVDPINLFQGMYWNNFHGPSYSLKSVKMLIRPIDRIFNPELN